MTLKRLRTYLDDHEVNYTLIPHAPAYTARGVAHAAHVSAEEMAKTVMIRTDGRLAMCVLPATCDVDLERIRATLGVDRVALVRERELENLFPECEIGAMPPLGNLYGVEVFVADRLTRKREIVFNAGTHTDLVKMRYRDFHDLVQPTVLTLAATTSPPSRAHARWSVHR